MRWWIIALAGCATPYQPGTLTGESRSLGDCLEIALQRGERSEAVGPVVVFNLGNKCDHSVLVDLASVHVVGGSHFGAHIDLVAFDPDHEIRPRDIAAFASGAEWIEYRPAGPYEWLDVDVARVAGAANAPPSWVRLVLPH